MATKAHKKKLPQYLAHYWKSLWTAGLDLPTVLSPPIGSNSSVDSLKMCDEDFDVETERR